MKSKFTSIGDLGSRTATKSNSFYIKKPPIPPRMFKGLKEKEPDNQEAMGAVMDRFEHDCYILKTFHNKNKRPQLLTSTSPVSLVVRPDDYAKNKVFSNPIDDIRKKRLDFLGNYSNPVPKKPSGFRESKSQPLLPPLQSKCKVKRNASKETPHYVKQVDLEQDSFLSIDDDYDPEAHIILEFPEFTRLVAHYKKEIARKLVRNIRLSMMGKVKEQHNLFSTIMAMDNGKAKKYTLLPFETMMKEYP
jgi:hypothetical protein